MSPTWSEFIEGWELFRDPVLSAAIAGAVLGYLSVYIVLRRMVFVSAAVTQSAGLGVALHVSHFAREALVQPRAQPVEAVGRRRRCDAGQLEAERVGLLLEAFFQGRHKFMITARRRARGRPAFPALTRLARGGICVGVE